MRDYSLKLFFYILVLIICCKSTNSKLKGPVLISGAVKCANIIIARVKVESVSKGNVKPWRYDIVKAKIIDRIKCSSSYKRIIFETNGYMEVCDNGEYKKNKEYLVFLENFKKKSGCVNRTWMGAYSYFPIDNMNTVHYWSGINSEHPMPSTYNYDRYCLSYKRVKTQIIDYLKKQEIKDDIKHTKQMKKNAKGK